MMHWASCVKGGRRENELQGMWFQQEFVRVGSSSCHFHHRAWLSYERQRRTPYSDAALRFMKAIC